MFPEDFIEEYSSELNELFIEEGLIYECTGHELALLEISLEIFRKLKNNKNETN